MAIQVVILAAGVGTRMRSHRPKVLQEIAGKTLIQHVIQTATTISEKKRPIVIDGHQGERIREALSAAKLCWVRQKEQLGTGHALLQALPDIADDDSVLVLYGDVPLISPTTLQTLIQTTPEEALGLLTTHVANATGYGRIKRDEANRVIGIVEEKEATAQERLITEINPGIYLVPLRYLKKWLPLLRNDNAQGEYYLTDIVTLAVRDRVAIHTLPVLQSEEVMGVNDAVQLAQLERFYQRQCAEKLMRQGVILRDPARLDIRGDVHIGRDVTLDVNVMLEGRVVIGDECTIEANTILRDTELGCRVQVKVNSVIEGAVIADDAVIGPFARLRSGTVLGKGAHIGNFVEIKSSIIGSETKVNHLSYVGDSDIGKRVNIGAGTITCNYDGAKKHKTIIGDHAFIGSSTQLVAPVTIGEGATIGTGSVVTKDAPPHQLTLTLQLNQRSIKDWQRPVKDEES